MQLIYSFLCSIIDCVLYDSQNYTIMQSSENVKDIVLYSLLEHLYDTRDNWRMYVGLFSSCRLIWKRKNKMCCGSIPRSIIEKINAVRVLSWIETSPKTEQHYWCAVEYIVNGKHRVTYSYMKTNFCDTILSARYCSGNDRQMLTSIFTESGFCGLADALKDNTNIARVVRVNAIC